ncbi:Maf family protein, partial [bacterium]|nr:Maf family protein [bacterium]
MIKKNKRRIILVSNSPRRRQLLEQMGLEFETAISEGVDEDAELYPPYHEAVERLSLLKAKSVIEEYNNSILIAADTIVLCNSTILGKPENDESAAKMLKFLRNKKHLVIT